MPSCMAPSGGVGLHVTSMPKLFFNVFCHCLVFTYNYSFSSFFVSTEEKAEGKLCFTIILVLVATFYAILLLQLFFSVLTIRCSIFYSFHFLVVSMMIMHIPAKDSLYFSAFPPYLTV